MTPAAVDAPTLARAKYATYGFFVLAGVAFASWASRIADTKNQLALGAGELGTTLFAMSAGSVIALPLTGRVVERFGVVRTIRAGLIAGALGAIVVGLGVDLWHSRPVVMAGLFALGAGIGGWDVAMNLEAADVERHLKRSIMPHFHAAFSAGTVVTALVGSFLSWAGVLVSIHLTTVGFLALGTGLVLLRWCLPHEATVAGAVAAHKAQGGERGRSAWREPRTLLIGVVVLVAAFTEGTANDWLAVAFHEGHGLPTWAGVLGLATFLAFMTAGRILGTGLLDRHGRVPVLRVSFLLALVGAALVILGTPVLAFAGAAIWGVGAALGFPVGMSAAGDDQARATARMSVIATIGYAAFIAGPPLLGYLGDHVGVLRSLTVIGVAALLALLVVPATREPRALLAGESREPAGASAHRSGPAGTDALR